MTTLRILLFTLITGVVSVNGQTTGLSNSFFIILFTCSINCATLLLYDGFYGELYVAQICVYLQFFIHVNTIGSVKRDVGGRPKVKNENRWCVQPFKTSRLFKVVGTDSLYATS